MLETIMKRRSIRSYTGESINDEELDIIIKAANASPVGLGMFETMHLTVIKNKELLKEIEDKAAKAFNKEDYHPFYGAPMLIVVSSQKPMERMENVVHSNAAGIVENMALAATSLGIGCCHIWGATAALSRDEELLSKINIPEGFMVCCGIILGKTNEVYETRDIPNDKISRNIIE